jgi:transposase, IS6 family
MTTCPTCHQPATTRDGFDRRGRQRFVCSPCHRDFTHASSGAFSGYRWPPGVIVTAVRWYLSYPLSARQVTELLAERGIDVSARTVLTWTQTFGPQLATAAQRHRRRLGRRWYVDEVFLFHGAAKRYLYRAVDEHGQVIDVLLRERRNLASAQAFFRRARASAETDPAAIVTDHHQPYVRAAQRNLPGSLHIRTGLHRPRGETTKPIERIHIATRDRLRASRGLKTTATGQRFLDGFEAMHALRRGDVGLRWLVPGYRPQSATRGDSTRAVAAAMATLAAGLRKAA